MSSSSSSPAPAAAPSVTVSGNAEWNKNSWHWEEKLLTPWAHDRIRALVSNYVFTNVDARITKVDKLAGDCQVTQKQTYKQKKLMCV